MANFLIVGLNRKLAISVFLGAGAFLLSILINLIKKNAFIEFFLFDN